MKLKKYIALSVLATTTLGFVGCSSDYLDTAPSTEITDERAASSLENLYNSLNGIHRKMVSQDGGVQAMGGEPGLAWNRDAMADDLTWAANTWSQGMLRWDAAVSETSYYNYMYWERYYNWILNANFILAGIDKFMDEDPALAKAVKGEALCFRAYLHFNLVQIYGIRYTAGKTNDQLGVIYRLEPTAEPLARNTVEECYKYINDDLDAAITLLAGYVPNDVNHFSQEVAYGLKARVALAQQNYPVAADAADKSLQVALKNGFKLMSTEEELMCGFADITSDTKEAMWAAMTRNDQTVYFYSYYAYMAWNFNSTAIRQGVKCISQTTYDMMSVTDIRRAWWDPTASSTGVPTGGTPQKYQVRKFEARSAGDPVGDYAFMRIAEIYLMKAEALARSGKDAEAQAVLTEFAVTRDPAYVSKGNTGSALIEEIMTHRRIELWGEGFRWNDLKRLNMPLNRTGSNFDVGFCGLLEAATNDKRWQFLIPRSETNANDLIVQNEK